MYDFEVEHIASEIKRRGAKRVLLQFPDGLKNYALKVVDDLQAMCNGVIFIVSADPCYGGCDVAVDEASRLGVDLIVHFGHTPYPMPIASKLRVPVIYVPAYSMISVDDVARKAGLMLRDRGFRKIGLVAVLQHIHVLDRVRSLLEDEGFKVVVGGRCGAGLFNGQILGCDVCAALSVMGDVEAFLVLAGGDFHALGVALATGKPVFVADPYRNECRCIDGLVRKVLSLRWFNIVRASEAEVFGIVVGVKPGQARIEAALRVRDFILSRGRKCYLIAAREINPESLLPFHGIDAFVIAACPRIAIDDGRNFKKPVLTIGELKIALSGERPSYSKIFLGDMVGGDKAAEASGDNSRIS